MVRIGVLVCSLLGLLLVTASASAQTELIINGSFASNSTGWTRSGDFYANSTFSACRSCPGYAYVSKSDGSAGNNLSGTLYQTISIPSGASSVVLTFWYHITTTESTGTAYDFLAINVQSSGGSQLQELGKLSNLNRTTGYTRSASYNLAAYAGQTVRIQFKGDTDYADPTTFRVDDVSVLATVAQTPAAPSNLQAVGSANSVLMQWSDNSSNESGFRIERRTGTSGSFSLWNQTGSNTTAAQNSGLSYGTVYCYRVASYNGSGPSGFSNESCATTLVTPSLTSPANAATLTSGSVTLQWDAVSQAQGYGVDLGSTCGGTEVLNNHTAVSPLLQLTNLGAGTWHWRVRALSSTYPGVSQVSSCRSFTVSPSSQAPVAPSGLQAVGSGNRVVLSWTDNSTNETGFRIERKVGTAGSWTVLVQLGSNASTYENTSLTYGTVYCYRVQAFNGSSNSGFSSEACGSPLATPVPSAPADGAQLATTTVTLQWSTVSGVDGYGLEVGRSCGDTSVFNSAVASPSQVLSSLSGTYVWRVRAVKGTPPGLSDYSACRSFTFGTALPPPALLEPGTLSAPGPAVSLTPTFRWNAVTGADGYGLYISKKAGTGYTLIFDSELRYGGPIRGTSLALPAGVLATGGEYRWDMRSHGSAGWGTVYAGELYFTNGAGAPGLHHFQFAAVPSPQVVGSAFDVTLSARDASGGAVSFNGEVALSSTVGGIAPIRATLSGGTVRVAVKLDSAGSPVVIRAFGAGASGESNAFTVTSTASSCTVSLGGLVTNENGDRLTDATVFLQKGASPLSRPTSTGSYQFQGLAPGTYSLWTVRNANSTPPVAVSLTCGSFTRDVVHPDCNPGDLTPVLLVAGILGSSSEWLSPVPTLPPYPLPWNSKEWPAWQWRATGGLYDHLDTPGWRKLVEQLQAVDSRYEPNCTIIPVPYDWRLDPDKVAQDYLKPAIDHVKTRLNRPDGKVDIVAHSLGSLVARAYIQSGSYDNDVRKLAMVGPPNEGSGTIYPLWQGGDPKWADELGDSLVPIYTLAAENQYSRFNAGRKLDFKADPAGYRSEMYKLFHKHVLSMRALLPTSPRFINSSPLACEDNYWLAALNSSPNLSRLGKDESSTVVKTKIFVGSDNNTVETLVAGKRKCEAGSRYQDGAPFHYKKSSDGDGSVLIESAKAANSAQLDTRAHFEASSSSPHSKLIGAYRRQIAEFLTDRSIPAVAEAALAAGSSLSASVLGRVEPYLVSPQGAGSGIQPQTSLREDAIPDSIVLVGEEASSVTVEDAAAGKYFLSIRGRQPGSYNLFFQYTDTAGSAIRTVRGFNHGEVVTVAFSVDPTSPQKLVLHDTPPPPAPLRADLAGSATRLSWPRSPEPFVDHYNVYARAEDEPDLVWIATTAATVYEPGHPWAADASVPRRTYAVSAVMADGHESFLSNEVSNDDRDHDGLSDLEETARGTGVANPDSDGDGLTDGDEVLRNSNPLQKDSDGDGAADGNEVLAGSDPLDPASTPAGSRGLDFYTVPPCRLLDTRDPPGPAGGPALAHGNSRVLAIAGSCGIPASAQAIAANVTIVHPSGPGHLTLYPGDMATPPTSSLNFSPGQVRANSVVLPLATDGTGTLALRSVVVGPGQVHAIVDVSGYFAPAESALPGEIVRTLTQGAAGAPGKDIWTTSVYSYDPRNHQSPGGGLDNEELRVGGWGDEYDSLLQFDLAGLPQQASAVRLELHCLSSGSGSPAGLLLDRLTEDWDWRIQGTGRDRQRLWWADRPDSVQWGAQELPAPVPGSRYTIDITDLYHAWQNGTFPNLGLQLRPTSTANRWGIFASSQHSDPALRPRLVVVP